MNIIEIESKDNKKIKELNKLKLKKYRQKSGLFVVENWKIIQDAFRSDICFKEVFLTKDFLNRNNEELADTFGENGSVFLVADSIGKNFSSLDSPQGIWAIYEIKEKQIDFKKDIIYLNGINDPGNLGTILRSSLAFGIENVVLDEKCVDVYNSKVIQAAKDAIFKLNIVLDRDKKIIQQIKEKNIKIYVTDVRQGEDLENVFNTAEKKCIILGSESHGVEASLGKEADSFINIKTTSKIESLNVAISAGIIFYKLFKSRN